MDINKIALAGKIYNLEFSYEHQNVNYYCCRMKTKRLSGVVDDCLVVMPEQIATQIKSKQITVYGSVRSRRELNKLITYVYADAISDYEIDANEAVIEGYVCSEPYHKKVKNKDLMQFLFCLNNYRKHYVSLLIWAKTSLKQGDKIVAFGRLQSREFWSGKSLEMINEISVYKWEFVDRNVDKKTNMSANSNV